MLQYLLIINLAGVTCLPLLTMPADVARGMSFTSRLFVCLHSNSCPFLSHFLLNFIILFTFQMLKYSWRGSETIV